MSAALGASARPARLLDPGLCLTLRPMSYPSFFESYRAAIKNTWTVEEVDFATDTRDLRAKLTPAETHLVQRLVAFFATGDSIVANNLVLTLYRHLNAPEARMYLSRQLYEEALHVQFYLTLLDTYVPDPAERQRLRAVETILHPPQGGLLPEVARVDGGPPRLDTREHRRAFCSTLVCFAACVEALLLRAFAYVYSPFSRAPPRARGGPSWVFRDESGHMGFAFDVVRTIRAEEPDLWDEGCPAGRRDAGEAVDCEAAFAEDLLGGGVAGLSVGDVRAYLEYCADQRLVTLVSRGAGDEEPLAFLELQDVQEVTNSSSAASPRTRSAWPAVVFDAAF